MLQRRPLSTPSFAPAPTTGCTAPNSPKQERNATLNAFLIITLLLLCSLTGPREAGGDENTRPSTNNGKRWRIGYCEGGPYLNYPHNLRALIEGLSELGWLERVNIPGLQEIVLSLGHPNHSKDRDVDPNDSVLIWRWLSRNARSGFIHFVEDACWSANWDGEDRKRNKQEALRRCREKEIDFMIAMGTWAGQDLATNAHAVPTMVMSTSDAVEAGIIKSPKDSGYDHVHAKCDPSRYLRQLRLFHSIINFRRLGVVYENTREGRTYAAIEDIMKVSRERGFEVFLCEAPFSGVERKTAIKAVISCHKELAPKVDAVYVTVHRGIAIKDMTDILAPLIHHRIPTFSQRGILEVKYGVLYCVDRGSYEHLGRYHAEIMARILNGAKPGDLDQVFEEPKKIVINVETAKRIGYHPPPNILRVADEVYGETGDRR